VATTGQQQKLLEEVRNRVETEYQKKTPKGAGIMEKAYRVLPGGDTRRSIFFFPYPLWIKNADGCHLWDEDGNQYLDFHNCYTVMMLGHGNPAVKAAMKSAIDEGTTALGAFKSSVVRWADILCERLVSFDQVRFTNTGSEAIMLAIRAARAFTGKDKIIMEEGGYHGCYDAVVFPPDSNGLPTSLMKDTIIVPHNDNAALEQAIMENRGQVAALVLEGLMGAAGMIPPADGYLEFARKITAEYDILFIQDEIITFRLDQGGMQHLKGIRPDLTTVGKIVAGGTPGAAFGGRRDIMQQFSPEAPRVHHAGTLNANPLTAAAGVAQLEQTTPELIDRLNALGESLANGIRTIFARNGIRAQVTGMGSLMNVHFSPVPIVDGRTAREQSNKDVLHLFHLSLVNHGILTPERGMFCISAPMSDKEIRAALDAVEDVIIDLKPYIVELWPDLSV